MTMSQRGTKTSVDLLQERNALRERVERLERSIDAIVAEVDLAEQNPDIVFLVSCRIRAIAERARSSGPSLVRASAFDAAEPRARSA